METGSILFSGKKSRIVYLHGGGYVFGSPQTHARIASGLARRTGADVLLPKYPLAPENRWPAQLKLAITAAKSPGLPVILAGDSAGGHLALTAALELARLGFPPAGLVLFSPNTDRSGLSQTREVNQDSDPMVDDQDDRDLARLCFGDLPDDHPQVSPLIDDLSLLPPTYIEVGAGEVLLGDSLLLTSRARAAGADAALHIEPDGLHMMQLWAPWWPKAAASLDRAATFINELLGADENTQLLRPLSRYGPGGPRRGKTSVRWSIRIRTRSRQ